MSETAKKKKIDGRIVENHSPHHHPATLPRASRKKVYNVQSNKSKPYETDFIVKKSSSNSAQEKK